MGAKTRRRFVFESENGFYSTSSTCREQFVSWTLFDDDEEYDGDDEQEVCKTMRTRSNYQANYLVDLEGNEEYDGVVEREVCEIMPIISYQADWPNDLETDERGPCRKKQKLELNPREQEKGAVLAYPDPWGPPTTDEEDLEHLLHVGLDLDDTEGLDLLPALQEMNAKVEGRPSYLAEGMDKCCDDLFDKIMQAPLDLNFDFAVDGLFNPAADDSALGKQGLVQVEILDAAAS